MNDNDPGNAEHVVIERDPSAIDIPCIFCGRTKRTNPEMEFPTDGRNAICTKHAEEAMFLINNADRVTLQDWLRSMERMWRERIAGRDT